MKYVTAKRVSHFQLTLWNLEVASDIHDPHFHKTIRKRKQLYIKVYKR